MAVSSHVPYVPLGLFVLGLGAAAFGAHRYRRRERADPYDGVTRGTVLAADLETRSTGPDRSYAPDIRYEYEVDGRTYENDVVRASDGRFSRRSARVLLGTYEEGAPVSVHYDPEAPDRSVLVPGESGRAWLVFVAAGLLTAAGALVLGL